MSAKLVCDSYIKERLEKYTNAMQLVFRTSRKREIKLRRKIFFCTWFFFTHRQHDRIEHSQDST